MEWRPIETAPKDGSWILLRGGVINEACSYTLREMAEYGTTPNPAVVGFAHISECGDLYWNYAWWDSNWRSDYQNPTEWMPIPK